MSKYLGTQRDGHHYTDMKLQPVQLGEMLGATPEFVKVAKYLTRDKGDKIINIEKAEHCCGLEEELGVSLLKYPWNVITGWKWKYFKGMEIHPYIKMFTDDTIIQSALQYMLVKDYSLAEDCINTYKELKGE